MREALELHARDIEVPPLSDSALVQRGFRQFQAVCVPCHGAPGVPSAQMGKGTNPAPPELSETVHKWTPAELFWIVKYGLKMTGMRSEEHTSELQSLMRISYAVFCLKKKN